MWILSYLPSRYTSLTGSNDGTTSSTSSYNVTFKLTGQIILLQIFYYFTAIVSFYITSMLLGWNFELSWIWSWRIITLENSLGLTLMFLWLLNALFSVILITFIIGRSKLVWDFALTIHFINLVIVWFTSGFPKNIYWWLLQCVSLILMMILGIYTTRWIELRDTFFDQPHDIELGNINK
ncbi:hypothetical protein C6P40_002008 [Pichia californica]|uniref:Protein SYS1 n=1 Tax=Pichia californica TaxID=460514 RepID=A0A9P6WIE4_9ASCO|nr:hypothetical protein C6P42_002044 [[Candida] californica]KAG0687685.1 hypothetical protein C6P40_002008 [[Candida] californica]